MVWNQQAKFYLDNAKEDYKSVTNDVFCKYHEMLDTESLWNVKCSASSYEKYKSLFKPILPFWTEIGINLDKCVETCEPLREKSWVDKLLGKGYRQPQAMDGFPD